MKKFLLILLSCSVLSCGSDEEELINDEDAEEILVEECDGSDPYLNLYGYTFSNKGDSITIYSTKYSSGLSVGASSRLGTWTDRLYYSETGYIRGYYGDWWYAASPDKKPYDSYIDIVVQPNDTGEERVIPIYISYLDGAWGAGKFIQEK